jgi:hypothetical protein
MQKSFIYKENCVHKFHCLSPCSFYIQFQPDSAWRQRASLGVLDTCHNGPSNSDPKPKSAVLAKTRDNLADWSTATQRSIMNFCETIYFVTSNAARVNCVWQFLCNFFAMIWYRAQFSEKTYYKPSFYMLGWFASIVGRRRFLLGSLCVLFVGRRAENAPFGSRILDWKCIREKEVEDNIKRM